MGRRPTKYFTCDRCGKLNPDFLTFGVGFPTRKTYCLDHIPWAVRASMWLREWREHWKYRLRALRPPD